MKKKHREYKYNQHKLFKFELIECGEAVWSRLPSLALLLPVFSY